jgi:hypothetical protein
MSEVKKGWGGRRPGAGRKPLSDEERQRRRETARRPDDGLLEGARLMFREGFDEATAEVGHGLALTQDVTPTPEPDAEDNSSCAYSNNSSSHYPGNAQLEYAPPAPDSPGAGDYLNSMIMAEIQDFEDRRRRS